MHAAIAIASSLIALVFASTVGAEPASTPMQSLSYFVGSWNCAGVFPKSGKTIASTMRYEMDLQGSVLVKHHDDTAPTLYRAIEAWGYDGQAKSFNATVMDNFGGARRFSSDGWKHDVFTWSAAADVKPIQHFVYTRLDEKSYRVDWEVLTNGVGYMAGDILTCRRR